MKFVLLAGVLFFAVTGHAAFTDVVKKDAGTSAYCPGSADGETCRMSFASAKAYCESIGGALPTVRELANWSVSHGAEGILETNDVPSGKAPAGYYLVASHYEDRPQDQFYFNHSGYVKPDSPVSGDMFWTLSTALQNHDYAHVFYGEFGGGGGRPEEHHKAYLNAVICSK